MEQIGIENQICRNEKHKAEALVEQTEEQMDRLRRKHAEELGEERKKVRLLQSKVTDLQGRLKRYELIEASRNAKLRERA